LGQVDHLRCDRIDLCSQVHSFLQIPPKIMGHLVDFEFLNLQIQHHFLQLRFGPCCVSFLRFNCRPGHSFNLIKPSRPLWAPPMHHFQSRLDTYSLIFVKIQTSVFTFDANIVSLFNHNFHDSKTDMSTLNELAFL
jgi:hypothetical protein